MRNSYLLLLIAATTAVTGACKDDKKSETAEDTASDPTTVISSGNPDTNSGTSGGMIPIGDMPPDPGPAVTPPTPSIDFSERPVDPTFNSSARLAFSARYFTPSSFSCSIDGGAFAVCTSPLSLPDLAVGQHAVTVKALAGGQEVKATYAWSIDQTLQKMPVMTHFPSSTIIQDYVESEGSIFFATNQGFISSHDGGKTATVKDGNNGLATRFTYKMDIVGEKIFLATQTGLAISTDFGATFQTKTSSDGLHNSFVSYVFYDRVSGRLYALHSSGLSYSDNDGATFTAKTVFNGLGVSGFSQIFVTDAGRVFLRGTNQVVYTAPSLDGTYATVISNAERIFVTRSGHLYVATASGLQVSTDNGATFVAKQTTNGLPSNTTYSVAASEDGQTILVGTAAGYAYSFDGGLTFESGSIASLSTGLNPNTIGRVFLSESGKAMITDQTTPVLSLYQMRDRYRSHTDFVAPTVTAASLTQRGTAGSGVGLWWSPATDDITGAEDLVYEIFSGSVGADLGDLQAVYTNGQLVSRHQGVESAPLYLDPSTDKQAVVVVKDESGNKTVYDATEASSSPDIPAQAWSEEAADGGMGKLIDHRVTQLGSKLLMVGGVILDPMPITVQNKVYSSLDGVNWSEVAQSGSAAERADHGLVSFDGKVWISGGYDASGFPLGDVSYSVTGATWTTATASPAFGPRRGHGMVAFKNKMWVIGGNTKPAGGAWAMKSDVWSSSDGITWTKATDNAGFTAAAKVNIVATPSYLYFLGEGTDTSVWRSADGITWDKILHERPTGTNFSFAAVLHGNDLYTIGGSKTNAGIWRSPDGVIWEEVATASDAAPQREDHAAISYLGKLWFFQGIHSGYKADIWSGE